MAISLAEFKQAFAADAGDGGGLARRMDEVADALNTLHQSVKTALPGDAGEGPRKAVEALASRYKLAKDRAGRPGTNAAAELEEILRQTRAVAARLENAPGGPLADSGAPPTSAPSRPSSRPQSRKRKMRTGVVIVPSLDTVRAGLEAWAARNLSKSKAAYIINLSNVREMHQDSSVLELFGAEVLAEVQTGSDGAHSVQFSWDPRFQGPDPNKYWEPRDGNVAMIVEVVDGKTGVPVKGARVRFGDGQAFITDDKGRARMESSPGTQWKVEVSAPGYQNAEQNIITGDRPSEYAVRLAPLDPKTTDKVVMGITVIDLTTADKIAKAKVTVGRQTLPTDTDGFVNFYLLPGSYLFSVTATGFVKETGSLEIPESKEQEFQTISIRPSGSADVFVRVLDAGTGSPIARCAVRLGAQHERTDSHGEARFGGIPFGEHRLLARADDYAPYDGTISHNKSTGTAFQEVKLRSQ